MKLVSFAAGNKVMRSKESCDIKTIIHNFVLMINYVPIRGFHVELDYFPIQKPIFSCHNDEGISPMHTRATKQRINGKSRILKDDCWVSKLRNFAFVMEP